MKRLIITVFFIASLAGCMKSHDFGFLKEGETTPVQLVENLGEASTVIDIDGTVSYIYNYGMHQKAFTFEDGVLILLENITEVDGDYIFETVDLD